MGPKPKVPAKPILANRPKKKMQTHKLAPHISEGKVVIDTAKRMWKIGKSIGRGGFGEIYTVTTDSDMVSKGQKESSYVAKIEPKANGPLFTERSFYCAAAKPETIEEWKKSRHLKFLGMPPYIASGSCEHSNEELRFLVMHRYGTDIHKLFEQNGRKMPFNTVMNLGIKIMHVLEYIHGQGYIHGDIKGSNLLLGVKKGEENEVYLVDYGLAVKYIKDGVMRRTETDSRFAHNGTIEFASRDAHQGKSSRRSDLEILGYNLVQWLAETLPWEEKALAAEHKQPLSDEQVAAEKESHMKNISKLVDRIPETAYRGPVKKYLEYVASLGLEDKPDYERCRKIFRDGLKELGLPDDGKLDFTGKDRLKKPTKLGLGSEPENLPEKRTIPRGTKPAVRKPCAPKNTNRPSPGAVSLSSDSEQEVFRTKKVKMTKRTKVLDSSADSTDRPAATSAGTAAGVPTPAMLAVMALKEKLARDVRSKKGKKSSRSNDSSVSSVENSGEVPTPAMLEVMRRREMKASKSQKVASPSSGDLPDMEVTEILPNANRRRSQGPRRRPPSKLASKKGLLSKISPIAPARISAFRSPGRMSARSSPRFQVSIETQTSPGVFTTPRITRKRNYQTLASASGAQHSPEIF